MENCGVKPQAWIRLASLSGLRIGIDADLWFTDLDNAVPDQFRAVLGGVSYGALQRVNQSINFLQMYHIKPVFVFSGLCTTTDMDPATSPLAGPVANAASAWSRLYHEYQLVIMHQQYHANRKGYNTHMDIYYGADHPNHKPFFRSLYNSTDRETMTTWMHYMAHLGVDVIVAPNFPGAQLAYMASTGMIDFVLAPHGCMIFGPISRIGHIVDFKPMFQRESKEGAALAGRPLPRSNVHDVMLGVTNRDAFFESLGLSPNRDSALVVQATVLASRSMLIDLLFHHIKADRAPPTASNVQTSTQLFISAVELLKGSGSAGLIGLINKVRGLTAYKEHLQKITEQLSDGTHYCPLVYFLENQLALAVDEVTCPLVADITGKVTKWKPELAQDLPPMLMYIMRPNITDSRRMPQILFTLFKKGWISPCVFATLVRGDWPLERSMLSKTMPCYTLTFDDAGSYDAWLGQLPLRRRIVGLLTMCLHKSFREIDVTFYPRVADVSCESNDPGARALAQPIVRKPDVRKGLKWQVDKEFCDLVYSDPGPVEREPCAANAFSKYHAMIEDNTSKRVLGCLGLPTLTAPLNDRSLRIRQFQITTHLMLMENLGFFTENGQSTMFGNFLAQRVPTVLFVDFIVLMEMLKQGLVNHEYPVLKSLPESFEPRYTPPGKHIEHPHEILLLGRVLSIYSLRWAHVHKDIRDLDFDLSLFASSTALVRQHIRLTAEACSSHLLLRHPDLLSAPEHVNRMLEIEQNTNKQGQMPEPHLFTEIPSAPQQIFEGIEYPAPSTADNWHRHSPQAHQAATAAATPNLNGANESGVTGTTLPIPESECSTIPATIRGIAHPSSFFCPALGTLRRVSTFRNNLGGVFMKALLFSGTNLTDVEALKIYLPSRFLDWVDPSWSVRLSHARVSQFTLMKQKNPERFSKECEEVLQKAEREYRQSMAAHYEKIISDILHLVTFWCLFRDLVTMCTSSPSPVLGAFGIEDERDGQALKTMVDSAHRVLCNKLSDLHFFKTEKFQELDDVIRRSLGMPPKSASSPNINNARRTQAPPPLVQNFHSRPVTSRGS